MRIKVANSKFWALVSVVLVVVSLGFTMVSPPQRVFADTPPDGKTCPTGDNNLQYVGDSGVFKGAIFNGSGLEDLQSDLFKNKCVGVPVSLTICHQGTATNIIHGAGAVTFCIGDLIGGGGDNGDPNSAPGGANKDVKQPDVSACDLSSVATSIISLKWVVCPIIEGATFLLGQFDDFLNSQLKGDMSVFDKSGGYHVAWNSFRVMALGLVVIAALVMIVSQATGLEIMDAYTTRKVLPVLLASAIMIGLSWDVLKVFYGLSNDATTGVRTIIYAPFSGMNQIELGGGSSFSLILVGSGAALSLGWMGLLSFVVTGVLAVALALLALLLIHTASYALLVVSPLAIACAILPNTRKGYEFWKGATISVLLAPVAVATVIAIFRVAAVISYNAPGNVIIHQLTALILYFSADFVTIWVISRVGGAAAMLTGVVNDRSRGAFDRLKNYRGKKASENFKAMKTGNRFSDNNPLSRTFNTASSSLGTGWKGRFGMGGRGAEARDQNRRNAAAELMKSAGYQAIADDDDALRAATYDSAGNAMTGLRARYIAQGKSEEEATAEARRAVQAVQSSIGFGRAQQFAAAQGMANTGTGFDNMEDQVQALARASGGNASTAASLAGYANFKNKEVKRHDLAPGFGNLYGAVRKEAGIDPGKPQTTHERQEQMDTLMSQAWGSGDPVSLIRDRGPGFKNHLQHWQTQYQQAYTEYQGYKDKSSAGAQAAMRRIQQAHTAFAEMDQNKMYGTGENVQALETAQQNLGAHMQWLKSQPPVASTNPLDPKPPAHISYYERGDARKQEYDSTGTLTGKNEDPNKMYQRFENNNAANQAQAQARVLRSPDQNRGDI